MGRDAWYSDEDGSAAGRFVPLYVLVNGRSSPRYATLDLATQVIARPGDPRALEAEHHAILRRCRGWISVAEIAAHLHYPLAATKLLVDALIEQGCLAVGTPAEQTAVDIELLETILVGLQNSLDKKD